MVLATMSIGATKSIGKKAHYMGAALFSFEGLNLEALRFALIFCDAIAGARRVDTSFFENCIEKNFHVPNMRAGPW